MPQTNAAAHRTSLAVWEIPPAVGVGEHFRVKIGAKSSAGCALAGRAVEVLDSGGAVIAAARLGEAPWPGTDALFWSEIELRAPAAPGLTTFAVRFDASGIDEPHDGASSPFEVAVVATPEHILTVTVLAGGVAVADAIVRAGPIRATTDAAGRARLHLAKGQYELAMWKSGYDAPLVPLAVEADAAVQIEAHTLPEDDPDAIWTA
jgi:hypothetical protein